jgi:hypothetical protein
MFSQKEDINKLSTACKVSSGQFLLCTTIKRAPVPVFSEKLGKAILYIPVYDTSVLVGTSMIKNCITTFFKALLRIRTFIGVADPNPYRIHYKIAAICVLDSGL